MTSGSVVLRAAAPRRLRLLDVKLPRFVHRIDAHVHDLAGGDVPDAGETFARDVHLVVAETASGASGSASVA